MTDPGSTDYSKSKNYTLNILIIVFAAGVIFLLYYFISRITYSPETTKKEIIDTVNNRVTKQRTGKILQIDIQNGSGIPGIAEKFTDYLREKGFDVVDKGTFSSSDIRTSMVIDRTGDMNNAKQVANSLGIKEKFVIQQINKEYFIDATVVIGRDYEKLYPFTED